MSMSVQKSQVYDMSSKVSQQAQDYDKITRDEREYAWMMIPQRSSMFIHVKPIRISSSLKSKLTMPYSQDEVKKTNLRAQDWTKHSMLGGSLQLVWETLVEPSLTLSYTDDEDRDLVEHNIKQCKRRICDDHYHAAAKVLSSSEVVSYNDATL
ncbi:hypothetical protein Tco_0327933 [Tanacetum coccineum]